MTQSSLRGQHVLVLGGLGFIGSNLAAACVDAGAEVTVFDCAEPRSGANRENIAGFRTQLQLLEQDVRDTDAITAAVQGKQIIFNCAALTSHPQSMQDPFANLDVNCRGLLNVLEAVRQHNRDGKVVHVGTSTQTGPMQYSPIDERHPEFPADIYSAHKTVGEKYALVYGRAHGLRTSVVRLANTYGPRACIRSPEFGFMNYFVGLGLQGREISVYGDGAQTRNISHVDDSVSALLVAAVDERANGEVFFATANEQVTVCDVAESIARIVGGSVRFVPWPPERAAIEIGDSVISNAKIKTHLGWTPSIPLSVGLARTRDYYAARLGEYL